MRTPSLIASVSPPTPTIRLTIMKPVTVGDSYTTISLRCSGPLGRLETKMKSPGRMVGSIDVEGIWNAWTQCALLYRSSVGCQTSRLKRIATPYQYHRSYGCGV